MDKTAQPQQKILVTDVGTPLGSLLSEELIKNGFEVYGSGKNHPSEELLNSQEFTFLDLDLSQPIPAQIPDFDYIVHLMREDKEALSGSDLKLSMVSNKLIDLTREKKTKVLFTVNITQSELLSEVFAAYNRDNLKLLALGHVYGPGMTTRHKIVTSKNESFFEVNELTALVSQALETDKIILENEGMTTIYPTFITDSIQAIIKSIQSLPSKSVRYITSSPPQNSLSIAYEIQNKARSVLHKELGLYFLGEESTNRTREEPQLKIHDSHPPVKHSLSEGLEETFQYLHKSHASPKITPEVKHEGKIILPPQAPERPQVKKSSKKIKLRLPRLSPFGGPKKKIFLGLFTLVVLSVVWFSTNLYLGAQDIKDTSELLKKADFKGAQEKAQSAQKHFSSSKKSAKVLTVPIGFTKYSKSLNYGLQSLESGSTATLNFTQGAQYLSQNLASVTGTNKEKAGINTEESSLAFSKAYFESEYAKTLAKEAAETPIFKSKFKEAEKAFEELSNLSRLSKEGITILPQLTGTNTKKTYLIILMNNAELRPGGGFIGNFAEMSFENNKLLEIKVEDIYTIDGQLKEVITPPPQLTEKLGVKQLYLRDSNWSTDFRINAQTIQDFYRKETGKTADGVIALDLTLVEKLLDKMGPVKLADYDEEITSANLFERGQYHSEVGFFPGSTQKRDFFSALTTAIMGKILDSLSTNSAQVGNAPWMALYQTLSEGLVQKHLMMSFDDPGLNTTITSRGWDNPVPPVGYDPKDDTSGVRDFLALSEANVGANKVNRYLKREVDYDMTIGRDADLMATLTITYKNESPANTWPGGTYVNYLRVLAPLNSSLEEYREDNKKIELEQTTRGITTQAVETTQAGELTQFAKLIEVPFKTTKTFTFKYRIPKNIKLESAPTYEFYVSKQPGTLSDTFRFNFNLPAYLKVDSIDGNEADKGKQNIEINSDLTTDRHYQIKVSRK